MANRKPRVSLLVSASPVLNFQAATALALSLGAAGNLHTETLRAFGPAEMKQIVEKMG